MGDTFFREVADMAHRMELDITDFFREDKKWA